MNDRIDKIAALRAKAADKAATEAEAIEAMEMANRLMEKWQITEKDLRRATHDSFILGFHDNILKTQHPVIKWMAKTVSQFCECSCWWDKYKNKVFFFGLEVDIRMAEYLMDMLRASMEADWRIYLKSPHKEQGISNHKLYWSFMHGWTDRVYLKFQDLIKAREPVVMSDGTSLIVLKQQLITEALAEKVKLKKPRRSRIEASHNSYMAGTVAGDRVNINKPITSARENSGQRKLS